MNDLIRKAHQFKKSDWPGGDATLPSIKIPKKKSSVVHKKHIVDRKKRLRVKSDPPKSKHWYSTRSNPKLKLSDDGKSRLLVKLQNKVEELSNRVMNLEKKRKSVRFKRSRKLSFSFVPFSSRSKRNKSLEVPTQSQTSENEDFDIEHQSEQKENSWDVSPPLSLPSMIVHDDKFQKFQDDSIDRTTLTNTISVITDDPMDVFHTPHESQDSYKDDAKEDNPIYDTGAKDPNGNEADDEGKIQFDSSANLSNKKQSPLEKNNIMEVNLEAGEASQLVVEPQPDDPMEGNSPHGNSPQGNAASQSILKDPNGNEADDEEKIQFDSSANLSQKKQSPLEQDNIMEDTLETVEASLSVLETQPEENIDDDPMREKTLETVEVSQSLLETQPEENIDDDPMMEETLETVEASHSVLETQPEENIDDNPMMEVILESGATSQSVELPHPDDPMEILSKTTFTGQFSTGQCSIAASHSLLETQPEVNIDGDFMKVTLEMPASSHSVSEAQPEEKIGNDPMEGTMETRPASHSLSGVAMFFKKKVTTETAAAIHSGVCKVNTDPMKPVFDTSSKADKEPQSSPTHSSNSVEHSNSPAREPDQYFELFDSSPARKREKTNLSQAEARLVAEFISQPILETQALLPTLKKAEYSQFVKTLSNSPNIEHLTKCGFLISNSFFVDLAKPQQWVSTLHMEVLVSLLSRRLTTTFENHHSAFVDPWFTSHLQAKFRAFNAAKLKSRVRWSEDMQRFIKGSKTEWFKDIDTIYAPMIWNDCHWVGLSINLGIWSVEILHPNTDLYDDGKVKRFIEPVVNLLPHLIQRYCTPEFSQNHGLQPFG
ncbi:unnamed protein product [Arabidopsis thaliana]|uniref:(thale cress) hypothetical protein n=1 Tax=Arabidopsis thaliana TaxID=3702 RepID=A0A7G2EQT7_ARATH|nr:unnamed protein product [Arabidopsis thaliana]